MADILEEFTQLRTLRLKNLPQLDSLRFLTAASALPRSLIYLNLFRCQHPQLHVSELQHVAPLQSLTALHFSDSFAGPLDADTRALYTPPSKRLPGHHSLDMILQAL
jgi:hypothetical protein